jgi:tRNA-specific 2-thiouridylase
MHEGAVFYTIGQRHGLYISGGLPYYVVRKDLEKNTVYVSKNLNNEDLWTNELELQDIIWRSNNRPSSILVRMRHRAPLIPATFKDNKVIFKNAIKRPASGQSVVFYNDTTCLGGGIIK